MNGKPMSEREVLSFLDEESRKKGESVEVIAVEHGWNRFELHGAPKPVRREREVVISREGAKIRFPECKTFLVKSDDSEIYHACPRCGDPVTLQGELCLRCGSLDFCARENKSVSGFKPSFNL